MRSSWQNIAFLNAMNKQHSLQKVRAAIVAKEPSKLRFRTYEQYRNAIDLWTVELKAIDRLIELAGSTEGKHEQERDLRITRTKL